MSRSPLAQACQISKQKGKDKWKMKLTIKSVLDLVVFANDEGALALRILDVSQLVEVSLPLQQEVDSFVVAVVTCIVQRSPWPVVLSHNVCSVLKKQFKALLAALLASKMKRRALMFITRFDVSTVQNECLQYVGVVVQRWKVKRSLVLIWKGINVSIPLNQLSNWLDVSQVRCMMQGSPSIRVNDVHISVLSEDSLKGIRLVNIRLVAKYSLMNRCLLENRRSLVNVFTTIHKVH